MLSSTRLEGLAALLAQVSDLEDGLGELAECFAAIEDSSVTIFEVTSDGVDSTTGSRFAIIGSSRRDITGGRSNVVGSWRGCMAT